jgi:hypothetical protein
VAGSSTSGSLAKFVESEGLSAGTGGDLPDEGDLLEYAEANLPGKPVRVFEGIFGGRQGHLMVTGAGRERGDQIALVMGAKGPTATAELNVSAPGVSSAALDELTETLILDLPPQPPPHVG